MRRFTTGMEAGTDLTHFWDAVQSGTNNYFAEVSTSSPRSGSNKLRFYRTTGFTGTTGTYVELDFGGGGANKIHAQTGSNGRVLLEYNAASQRCWFRFFFNVAVLPASTHTIHIFRLTGSTTTTTQAAIYFAAGQLRTNALGGTEQTLFVPTVNTWYRVEIEMRSSTGGSMASGSQFAVAVFDEATNVVRGSASVPGGVFTQDIRYMRFGMMPVTFTGTQNMDISFDDIAVNDDQGNFHNTAIGYGMVRGVAVPTANGGTNNFTRGGVDSGNNWDQVNDWVNTGGADDYCVTPAAAATHEEQYDHTSSATLGITGTITAVQLWIYHRDETGVDGTSHSYGLKDSGGNFLASAGALFVSVGSDTEYQQGVCIQGTGHASSLASMSKWTNSEFDNAANEFWIRHTSATANEQKRIMAIRMEVEETAGTVLGNVYHQGQRMVQGSVA